MGGQTIVTATTYEEAANVFTCANLKTCNKPKADENGRGYYTDYQWDSGTGLLTQVVSGADVNGTCQVAGATVCPQTDLGYGAFGGVQMLKTKTEKISASASTETDYGYYDVTGKYAPKTATVDAGTGKLNLTTTLTFDGVGNLIAADGPRSDVQDDSHYLWDSLRRLKMAIKPDPDNSGTLLRRGDAIPLPGRQVDGDRQRHRHGRTGEADSARLPMSSSPTTPPTTRSATRRPLRASRRR